MFHFLIEGTEQRFLAEKHQMCQCYMITPQSNSDLFFQNPEGQHTLRTVKQISMRVRGKQRTAKPEHKISQSSAQHCALISNI